MLPLYGIKRKPAAFAVGLIEKGTEAYRRASGLVLCLLHTTLAKRLNFALSLIKMGFSLKFKLLIVLRKVIDYGS